MWQPAAWLTVHHATPTERTSMSTEAPELAERLLEAHVAHAAAELSGEAGVALVAAEARHLLAALRDVPVGDVVDRDAVKASAATGLDTVGGSTAVEAMITTMVPALYELPASEEHDLGAVISWGGIEAIADVLTRSEQLREEVMRRLDRSPAVSTLAMRFVSALVGDAVQQNRERAEKVPGMKSVLGMGDLAARTARGMAPRQLEKAVGGAADKGTQAAMERVSRALVDAFDEDVVRTAVMEVWDLHAEDEIAGLRSYLPAEDVEHVTASGYALWLDARGSVWIRAAVDAGVDAFFDRYEEWTIGELLAELDLDEDVLIGEVERHAPRVLAALHRDGHLEAFVRRRLEPFYTSQEALAILADAG